MSQLNKYRSAGTGTCSREISLGNQSLATEATEKHGIFNKCVRVLCGIRGDLQGYALRKFHCGQPGRNSGRCFCILVNLPDHPDPGYGGNLIAFQNELQVRRVIRG